MHKTEYIDQIIKIDKPCLLILEKLCSRLYYVLSSYAMYYVEDYIKEYRVVANPEGDIFNELLFGYLLKFWFGK